MQWLKDFINDFWDSVRIFFVFLLDGILSLLNVIFTALTNFFYTVFDGFLVVVYGIFSALDFSALVFNTAASWGSMPPQLIWFINEIALPQCFTMVTAAVGIRMLLNLIPAAFTRI